MFWKKRSDREGAASEERAPPPPAPPSMPPPPAQVSAILLGPQGETRDWLASLLSARPEVRLLGAHANPEHAANALRNSTGRKETAVLIDATFQDPNEARSVIRMMRERFPTVRVVVYGNELDEIAIEGLYFLGADDVLLPQMQEDEDTAAIMNSVRKPVDAGVAKIPEPQIETPKDSPRPDERFLQMEMPAPPMEDNAPAVEVTAPAVEEPGPAMELPAPPMEETAPAVEETPPMEETAPATEETAEAAEEPVRAGWESRNQAIWERPVPAIEEQAPPIEESTPVREERARAKEEPNEAKASRRSRRPLMRRLGLLRSQRRRHAGWIPNQAKSDRIRFENDRVARNLERLVPPLQSPDEEPRGLDEDEREEPGPTGPTTSDGPSD